jgi:hypothetical protein
MLKSVDVLIGLSVLMLVVSMAVTLLTHFVTTTLNTRGGHLMRGLQDLLQQLNPGLTAEISKEISKTVLKHPLISDVGSRLGTVIHREEFIKILMDLAAGNGPQKLEGAALPALKAAMAANGIVDPSAALDNIRVFALELEKSNPELANDVRLNAAIMHESGSQFVAKIHGWFDQTIDRVSGRFTASTRAVTVVVALLVAFAIQLDSIALVNRLSTDTQLRQALVNAAKKIDQGTPSGGAPSQTSSGTSGSKTSDDSKQTAASDQKELPASNTTTTPAETAVKPGKSSTEDTNRPPASTEGNKDAASVSQNRHASNLEISSRLVSDVDAILGTTGLISAPDWKALSAQKVLGILLSAFLLTLGAPFWYDMLKTGLRLRAAIADKDDAQRQERQTTQVSTQLAPAGKGGMASASSALAGERGDLSATG